MAPDDKWVMRLRGTGHPRTRLICVPFAGGSPDLFRAWAGRLGEDLELLAVRLPGHGSRMMDRPYTSWAPLIEDTFAGLEPYLAEPHFFYGHSFGGRLAYERCQRAAAPYPGMTRGLFLSACRSPDRPQNRPYMHEMSDAGFRSAVREIGGTPGEVLEHKALMRLLLPAIHSEIRLAELWTDRHPRGVDAPIVAMYGRDDPIDGHASMRGWTAYGRTGSELLEMPGGHFFIDTHREALLEVIESRMGVFCA